MARPSKKNPEGKQKKTKLTPETVKKLEEAFSLDATVKEACFYADISREIYYKWTRENPKLSDRFEALREKLVLAARESVAKQMKSDGDLALKYLERKRKEEFSPRHELDLQGELKITKIEETLEATRKIAEAIKIKNERGN